MPMPSSSRPPSAPAMADLLEIGDRRAHPMLGVRRALGRSPATCTPPVLGWLAGKNWERIDMMHAKLESNGMSLASSLPKQGDGVSGTGAGNGGYHVQSPLLESHDGGYKSSSMQATPVCNNPNESPSFSSSPPSASSFGAPTEPEAVVKDCMALCSEVEDVVSMRCEVIKHQNEHVITSIGVTICSI